MWVMLGSALITSVNWAEVLQALGLAVETFSPGDADTAALLWPQTRRRCSPVIASGLS